MLHHDVAYWEEANNKFDSLSQLRKGESKDIRIIDAEHVIVKMIPSLYSFTYNRSDMIEGTGSARLRAFRKILDILSRSGIKTNVVHVGNDFYVTRRMLRDGRDTCPPIEVIVKARHVGTPKHTLYKIHDFSTVDGQKITPDRPHRPYVRFDYTNPLQDDNGDRVRDECIPKGLAARFMNVDSAERTALNVFSTLHEFFSARGVRMDDVCLKIAEDGETIFGEISPDCMRAVEIGSDPDFYGTDGRDASKDTFRAGSSHNAVLERYIAFAEMIEGSPVRDSVPLPGN